MGFNLTMRNLIRSDFSQNKAVVLNRRPPGRIQPASLLFVPPKLLFLHCVLVGLGQHVYTGTCLHANDTQTAGSLTAGAQFFTFTVVLEHFAY